MGFFSPPDPALSGQKPCATAAELGTETCFYQSDTLALWVVTGWGGSPWSPWFSLPDMEPPPSKQVGMGVIGLQRSHPLHQEGISHLMSLSWVRKGNSILLAMPVQNRASGTWGWGRYKMSACPSPCVILAVNWGLEGEGTPVFLTACGWSRASITWSYREG